MSDQVPERFVEAQRLIESGEYEAATKFCVMLWREGDFHERTLMVRRLLPKLATSHPPARAEFQSLRDGLTPHLDEPPAYVRWIQLCHALDDGAPVVQWLETVDLDARTVQIAIGDERVYGFAERAEALGAFARLIDLKRAEADARRQLADDPTARHDDSLVMSLVHHFQFARKALAALGRTEDDARLVALIETLARDFGPGA